MGKKCNSGKAPKRPAALSWELVLAIREGRVAGPEPVDFVGPGFSPAGPTEALPGTEAKIRALEARAARREQLFHPEDNLGRKDSSPPGLDFLMALARLSRDDRDWGEEAE